MLINLVWIYLAYEVCRFVFLFENRSIFSGSLSWSSLTEILYGGLYFDTSAIVYTNALYIVLMLLPLHFKESDIWQKVARIVYMICNGLCIIVNLADSVYFQYTGRRTTSTVFSEFSNEGNLGSVIGIELLRHWYLIAIAALMIWGLWKLYAKPHGKPTMLIARPLRLGPATLYYAMHTVVLAIFVPLCIIGMRGGATTAVRPITISNANQYVDRPSDAALVLNTPFSIIRTIGKVAFTKPAYMTDEEMAVLYSPLHTPADSIRPTKKNVVVLIVESFAREYIGALNKNLNGGKYQGYTPFVDSLIQHSVTYSHSYCNGRKSIDGMPSVLSGIPMFIEPFFLTPASTNNVSGIAGELAKKGYHTAFFHGAENGSMGFQAFARATGFRDYYGRTEFNDDERFRGDDDFDGTWAIWDEPFLQFFALTTSSFKQPFVSAVFTASSHHPFAIPDEYKDVFTDEGAAIHKCIRYTDNALRRFFATAKEQPWYENTLFVITADHTNQSNYDVYRTDLGSFCVPVIFFDPSGTLQPGIRNAIAQQTDIMPTVLNHVGYDEPYVAFGCDLFSTPADSTWAVNYLNGIYQYVKGDYMLRFDGQAPTGMYRFKTDSLLQENLVGTVAEQEPMTLELKAIIQQYMNRMVDNRLTADQSEP